MNNNIKQNLVKKHNTLLYKLKIKYSNLSNQNKNKLTNFYKTDINKLKITSYEKKYNKLLKKLIFLKLINNSIKYINNIDNKIINYSLNNNQNKILFTFLGGLPNNSHWEKFLNTIDLNKCIFVLHPISLNNINLPSYWNKLKNSNNLLIVDKEHHIKTKWATRSLVDAYLLMIQYSLLKMNNVFKKVILVSPNCYPLYNFNIIYNELVKDNKSWIYMNDESYSRWSFKKMYNYQNGAFEINNGTYMSQWHILDSSHLIYYFEYNNKEFIKTYQKINTSVKCDNQEVEFIEAINKTTKYQHYLLSMFGFYHNDIDNIIYNIKNNTNKGYCIGTDEHFIANILLFNLNNNFESNLLNNIRTVDLKKLINISDYSFLSNKLDKNILLDYPYEAYDSGDDTDYYNYGFLNINRIWFGNRVSFNKYNINKKLDFYINKKSENLLNNELNNLLIKNPNLNIEEIKKKINIKKLTENNNVLSDIINDNKLSDDIKNELNLIINNILIYDKSYIILTNKGIKYASINYVKNLCNKSNDLYWHKIHNNITDEYTENIFNTKTYEANKIYENTIECSPDYNMEGGHYMNFHHDNYDENDNYHRVECFIGNKKGYIFDNIYSLASTYTDWSLISFDPNNLFRNIKISKLFNPPYNDINVLNNNKLLSIFSENCRTKKFINFNTQDFYNEINEIFKINNNIINYNNNIEIDVIGPAYHPVEYLSWNLINIINAYNLIVLLKLYNRGNFNYVYNISLNNYIYHITTNKSYLNIYPNIHHPDYPYYTIKNEYENDDIFIKNNYGFIINSHILNNALAHGSLFIRKIMDNSCIELYTDELFNQKEYAHNILNKNVRTHNYNYIDMIYLTNPKLNINKNYSYDIINNLFKSNLNNYDKYYHKLIQEKFYTNDNMSKIKYILHNYSIIYPNKFTNKMDEEYFYDNKNYLLMNCKYYNKYNSIVKILSNEINTNEFRIYNYIFTLEYIIKEYIIGFILIPFDVFYINKKYVDYFFNDIKYFKKYNNDFNFIIMPNYKMTLKDYMTDIINSNNIDNLGFIIFDILYSINLLNNKLNIIHNDLNHNNIFIDNKFNNKLKYLLNNKIYKRYTNNSINIYNYNKSHTNDNNNSLIDIFIFLIWFIYYIVYDNSKINQDKKLVLNDAIKIYNGTYNNSKNKVYNYLTYIFKFIINNLPNEIKKLINNFILYMLEINKNFNTDLSWKQYYINLFYNKQNNNDIVCCWEKYYLQFVNSQYYIKSTITNFNYDNFLINLMGLINTNKFIKYQY